jgi:DNA-binding transcriptional ArsR family regulator
VREPSKGTDTPRAAKWLEVIADPVRLGILRSLSHVADATASDLAVWGQASNQTLRRHLEALVCLGVIREHPARSDGETPGRPAARYSLPRAVRDSVRAILDPPDSGLGHGPGSLTQAVGATVPAAADLLSTNSIAATGPMNGARAR